MTYTTKRSRIKKAKEIYKHNANCTNLQHAHGNTAWAVNALKTSGDKGN